MKELLAGRLAPIRVSLIAALLLWAGAIGSARAEDRFDRGRMLQGIVDEVIQPGQRAFIAAAEQLKTAAEAFANSPDRDALAALQSSWRDAADAWEAIAIFNMDLRLTAMHNQISKRPVNPAFISEILAGDDALSEATVDGMGSTSRGLPAIELLIFPRERGAEELTTAFDEERRRQFLVALAGNVASKALDLRDYWSPEGRDYGKRFVRADQSGGVIQGSINMLANKLFTQLEKDLQMWLGEPAGIATGGDPDPERVEARRSGHSLALISRRLVGMQALFNGGALQAGLGFAGYLDFLGAEYDDGRLSDRINERFDRAREAAAAIDPALAAAVVQSPEAVAELHEAMRQLLILLRADMKSHMSILITFSDLDGDQ